jgi:hypothetical protein
MNKVYPRILEKQLIEKNLIVESMNNEIGSVRQMLKDFIKTGEDA